MIARISGPVLLLLGLCPAMAGCGLSSVRSSQDWTGIEDPRIFRTCHVTNHGSGVCIARQEEGLFILANAHVVGKSETVTVHLPNPNSRRYESFQATVLACAHPTKVDLALLRIDSPPPGAPYKLELARELAPGEVRDPVQLVVLSAPDRPILYQGKLVENGVEWGGPPDDWGATVYHRPMACVYGGVRSANSGSPVFEGDRLIGLNEIHGFRARLPAGPEGEPREVVGIGISVPTRIRRFLSANLYDHLIAD